MASVLVPTGSQQRHHLLGSWGGGCPSLPVRQPHDGRGAPGALGPELRSEQPEGEAVAAPLPLNKPLSLQRKPG